MIDHYQTLGLTPQASQGEIKAAYRKLAKKYHPDAVADRPELAGKMYDIQAAYDILGDAEKRKKYDDSRYDRTQNIGSERREAKQTRKDADMSQFERFFGFQPGRGMDTFQKNAKSGKQTGKQAGGPINPEELFAAYFGKMKR